MRATAYFHDPREFLLAFKRDPAAALAKLEADPKAFGLRRPDLSSYGRERCLRSLLAAARKHVKEHPNASKSCARYNGKV
jgi:hypothetical protein